MRRLTHVTWQCALMLSIVAAFAAARPGPLQAQTVNVVDPTQVILADDLRSLGIARLGDVFLYLTGARTVSVDGFHRAVRLGALGSFHEPGPQLFVNGHPVGKSMFGLENVHLLGLATEYVDRVEIFARPALISGMFAGEGAIHIFTKQADPGAGHLHGRIVAGHNQSAAGPLTFPPGRDAAHSFDGPDVELAGLVVIAGGSALGSVVHRRHAYPERANGRRPLTVATSPFGSFTRTSDRLHLSVIGHGTRGDVYSFLPYSAHVTAADHRRGGVSALAAHAITQRSFLRHRATLDLGDTRVVGDAATWSEFNFSASSELARMLEERIVSLGAAVEVRRLAARTSTEALRWGSVFASIAGTTAPGVQYRGGGMVAMDGRSVAVKAYGGLSITRWQRHSADIYVAIVDGLIHEQNVADYWMRRELMHPLLPAEVRRPQDDVSIKATFDVGWRWQPSVRIDLRAGVGIRRSQKIYLPELSLSRTAEGDFARSIAFHYASGTQASGWGDLTLHLLPGRQRVFGSWHRTIAGDELYDEAWSGLPDFRLGISLASPIVRGFRGWAAVIQESRSIWPMIDDALSARAHASGGTTVDVFVSRRLLAGRIHASLGVRNALSSQVQSHPLGDLAGRSIRIDLRIDLARNR